MIGDPPTTKIALLVSEGFPPAKARVTRHEYVDTIPGADKDGGEGFFHRFRCAETGAIRVWGFDGTRPNGSTYQEV